MCEVKLSSTRGCGSADEARTSPSWGNRATVDAAIGCYHRALSQYRVLRAVPSRGGPRSVDRDCAGRNATSVKDVEPRQTVHFRGGRALIGDRLDSGHAKATPAPFDGRGTTGVQDHGMYRRSMAEHLRSAGSRVEAKRPWPRASKQGLTPKSKATLSAEVRCPHSSDEAGQRPWSEGGHGE